MFQPEEMPVEDMRNPGNGMPPGAPEFQQNGMPPGGIENPGNGMPPEGM